MKGGSVRLPQKFRRRGRGEPPASPDPRTAWPEQPIPSDAAAAAREFWQRWAELLPDVSAALGDREPQRVEHLMCAAVALLHPRLHFSLEEGQRAMYALVLSGQEDPGLRPYTDAWLAAAPAEDTMWEYHDSVPPVPDPTGVTVNLGEHRIALAEVRVAATVDAERGVVDVDVHHALLGELNEASRSMLTFLPLDAALGERAAAECLRRVETAAAEPPDSMGLLELREVVDGLRR